MALIAGWMCTVNCSTDKSELVICWHYKSVEVDLSFLYNGYAFSATYDQIYSIDKNDQGRANLVMDSVRPTHAGTYTCEETGTGLTASSELVVLGKIYHYSITFI